MLYGATLLMLGVLFVVILCMPAPLAYSDTPPEGITQDGAH